MSLAYFISKRLSSKQHSKFTRFIIRLATVATAISTAFMILAVAIVIGFKDTIKDKLFVFWDHIQINQQSNYGHSIIPEQPFLMDPALLQAFEQDNLVEEIQPYLLKPVIIQKQELKHGVRLKGVQQTYLNKKDLSFEKEIDNDFTGSKIILSKSQASLLNASIGDSILIYFMGLNDYSPRVRKLELYNIFHTGMQEIDEQFALSPLNFLQDLDQYNNLAIHGYQVALKKTNAIEEDAETLYQKHIEPPMQVYPLTKVYPNIFGWLQLLDKNAYIIIIIMAIVSIINLSTALLIFIIDRTYMIGILRSIGMQNRNIQQVVVYQGIRIAIKGILWGLILGLGIAWTQIQFQWLKLNEEGYYMSYVPIKLIPWHVILIVIGNILFLSLALYLPSLFSRRIRILKALKL